MTVQTANAANTHHYILTLQKPTPRGTDDATIHGVLTPAAGQTRAEIFELIRQSLEQKCPSVAGGSVIYFTLEPNQL